MCGIAGILELDASRAAPRAVLRDMLRAIVHRGPDDQGELVDRELAMGMQRLSIIDLQDGQQPIFNESGRFAIVFNGEIYNYVELRKQLINRGHKFTTQGDTEVIIHLFEEFGPECLDHLRGMFAFALWDNEHRELFIARDRLGIKPLYYSLDGGKLRFASEIKSILADRGFPRSLDLQALSHYLSLKYVPAPRTMFAGVECLLPGHYMLVREGKVEQHQYWDCSFKKLNREESEEDLLTELGRILRESVRLRLRSDVPFGAFLSGGVDSSIIVALMAEVMTEPVKTFSVGFDGAEGQDELPYALDVAQRFNCQHHTLTITAKDFVEHAESVLWHLDQPIADQATVATHMVAALARKHVKMVLTGEGGDELFAGYARYVGEQFRPRILSKLPFGGKYLRRLVRCLPGLRRGKIAVNALTQPTEATRFSNWFPLFGDDAKGELFGRYSTGLEAASEVFGAYLKSTDADHSLDRMLYCDSKAWLVDYLLLRGDKLTMANSLEARIPLLDHKLVEFAGRLPTAMKLKGKTRKYLLKRFAEKYLPHEIVHRKKQGFPIPIDKWLRNEARPMMRDLLSPDSIQRRGLFDPAMVQRLLHQHESGYADLATEIWGLASVEMWHRKYIDSSAPIQANPTSELSGPTRPRRHLQGAL